MMIDISTHFYFINLNFISAVFEYRITRIHFEYVFEIIRNLDIRNFFFRKTRKDNNKKAIIKKGLLIG